MTADSWYRSWFGEEYLSLYPHRDREEAEHAVRLLRTATGRGGGDRALDLGCGPGRHLLALEEAGFRAVGLDLSPVLLRRAREEGVESPLIRGDMRHVPLSTASLDVVTNFFTSFGYFSDAGDDRRVLGEVRRVLRPGGHVLLDFLNADRVRASLRPLDDEEIEGVRVRQERRVITDEGGAEVVEKTITVRPGTERERIFAERVRLYGKDDLQEMLVAVRLEPLDVFGDYRGGAFGPDAPRCLLTGRAV